MLSAFLMKSKNNMKAEKVIFKSKTKVSMDIHKVTLKKMIVLKVNLGI